MSLLEVLKDPETRKQYASLPADQRAAFEWRTNWLIKAHEYQILPPGDWWDIWLMLAGRGAGKTRTAAEQVSWWAWENPGTRWLVAAPTSADVRGTCFEGDSGLLSVIPSILIKDYNKALHELVMTNGSIIKGIPASEPERFRGPQFHGGWCCPPHTMIALPCGDEKAIEHIRPGDMVMTRHGARKVLAASVSGNPNDLIRIDCGETQLTTTDDHPILVGDQWIPAGEIKEGNEVWKASFTMGSLGTKGHQGIITTREGDICTDTFGSNITALFKKGLSFITQTITLITTSCLTWFSWESQSTSVITGLAQRTPNLKKKPQEKRWNLCEPQKLGNVFNAALSLFHFQQIRLASFVPANVWTDGETTVNILSKQAAPVAGQNSVNYGERINSALLIAEKSYPQWKFKKTSVKSVERLPNSLTYNLTVDGEHEFIANGIVVHNCDELAAWEYLQEAWDMMQFGMRLGKKVRIVCTTTPKPKDLIIDLVGREGDDVIITRASTYANLDNLADNFKKQILQYEGTKLGRQEIYAEILDPEDSGIVKREMFKLWPNGKEFPKFEYIIQSYDCAYTEKTINDPTACITFGVFKPQDGPMSVMVIDCWQDRLQYPDLRPKVIDEYEIVYGEGKNKKRVDLILVEDKSAGISLIQDLQRAHLPVRAYNPGKADKVQRLNIVSNIIARGRVWIPESSQRKGYVRDWAEGFVSQICSFPEATNDDFVDACLVGSSTVLMADGSEKRIDEIVVGDEVKTPDGSQRVSKTFNNGIKEIWCVETGNQMLFGTGNHRVMTQRGWMHIDRLIPNEDTVLMYPQEVIWRSQKSLMSQLKRLSLTAGVITDTLKVQTQRIVNTLEERVLGCIGMFGNTTTETFQRVITSTTLTATQPTTTYRIWPASQHQSIEQSTEMSWSKETSQSVNSNISTASGQKPQNGTNQRKGESGIGNMPLSPCLKFGANLVTILTSKCNAIGAALKWSVRQLKENTVDLVVKPPKASFALVKAVTNTHTTQAVYDLTVESEHCYYANGMLVHNCTQALRYLRDGGWLEIDPPPEDDYDEDDFIDSGMSSVRVNPYAM